MANINQDDFVPNSFLADVKGNDLVSSSMLEKIFIPSRNVPKALIDKIVSSPEHVQRVLLAQEPLYTTYIDKPYWKSNERPYDRIHVDIFGAVCLARDRTLLDNIVAFGNVVTNANQYTLRQVVEGLQLEGVNWEYFTPADQIDKPLLNRGIYFHVPFSTLTAAMDVTNSKKNREQMLTQLHRLSVMHLTLTPSQAGEPIGSQAVNFSLIDKSIFTILDESKVRNKKDIKPDTSTDLIVNVSSYYLKTLKDDGHISRKRMQEHYPTLAGPNNIEDFYKSIDSHKRAFINGKYLSDVVHMYFNNKMSWFGINVSYKKKVMYKQMVQDRNKLLKSFNLILKRVEHANAINGKEDFIFVYNSD